GRTHRPAGARRRAGPRRGARRREHRPRPPGRRRAHPRGVAVLPGRARLGVGALRHPAAAARRPDAAARPHPPPPAPRPRAPLPELGHRRRGGAGRARAHGGPVTQLGDRPPTPAAAARGAAPRRTLRILLWHVHGSWTTSFVHGGHVCLLPVTPDRGPDG